MTYKESTQIIEEIDGGASAFTAGDYGFQNTNALNGGQTYDFKYLSFPGDLGQENNGHYMVININVPVTPSALGGGARGDLTQFFALTNADSKLNRLRDSKSAINGSGLRFPFEQQNTSGATQGESAVAPRFTKRIAESIAIFMPSSLVYNTQHAYEDISLTAMVGTFGAAALSALGAAGAVAGSAISSFVGGSGGQLAKAAGFPINPRIEVLYAHTPQRQFVFEFLMSPRNQKESQIIKSIIKTLRFHSSAELTLKGFAFIPPAEFDITFFNKGVENINVPRINTCVLERVEADYSPTGVYSTFSTGHPVTVRLSLGFRELELVHKLRVAQGF